MAEQARKAFSLRVEREGWAVLLRGDGQSNGRADAPGLPTEDAGARLWWTGQASGQGGVVRILRQPRADVRDDAWTEGTCRVVQRNRGQASLFPRYNAAPDRKRRNRRPIRHARPRPRGVIEVRWLPQRLVHPQREAWARLGRKRLRVSEFATGHRALVSRPHHRHDS